MKNFTTLIEESGIDVYKQTCLNVSHSRKWSVGGLNTNTLPSIILLADCEAWMRLEQSRY